MSYKLSIIIPYFNEERRLHSSAEILLSFLRNQKDIEIVYVDDGSSDQTGRVLPILIKKYKDELTSRNIVFKFLELEENQGKGAAIQHGVAHATGDYILYTDFDFAISLDEVKPFLDATQMNQQAIFIASRRKDSIAIRKQSLLRKLFGLVFNLLMRLIINLHINDTQCGFKMFPARVAKDLFSKLRTKRFAFDVEILLRAQKANVEIVPRGVKIKHDDSFSTVNVWLDPFRMLWDILIMRIRM